MKIEIAKVLFSALLLSSLLPVSADATTVIFSDFGTGNTYNNGMGWTASGSDSAAGPFVLANEFTSSGDYSVSQIDLALTNAAGTNSADVSIWTDSGGVPGMQLGSTWMVSDQPNFGSTNDTITTISGIAGVNLISGNSYFLVIGPGGSSTLDVLNYNVVAAMGLDLYSLDGGSTWHSNGTQTLGAFSILGSTNTVPEPLTLLLFGAGLAGAAATRRLKAGPGMKSLRQ